jgi:pimeloyl-ACP methyl ester carboxylesterase
VKRTVVAIVIGLAVLLVLAVVAGVWLFRFRPLAVYAWTTRSALARAGLHEVTVSSPAGPQVVWTGGSGPVMVLLHGAGDQAGTWSRVAPALAKTHTLIVPDLAGHGNSAPQAGPIPVPAILDGLEADISKLAGGGKVTLVGNSLGAWMAMLIAHRHPEWVERVVAVNGGALTGHQAANMLPASRQEAAEFMKLVRDPSSQPIPGFVLDDVVRQAKVGALARFTATAATMEHWTLDGRLGEVKTPVTLIWGESDRLMPLDYARRMLAELPKATLVTLDRCGHVPQVECPGPFLAALEKGSAK